MMHIDDLILGHLIKYHLEIMCIYISERIVYLLLYRMLNERVSLAHAN